MFADHFPAACSGCRIFHSSPEALAELPYEKELELKRRAIADFLKEEKLPSSAPLVPAPVSRTYRSTGKRRISCRRGGVFLHFGRTPGKEPVELSLLEPESFSRVYLLVHKQLSQPRNREAAEAANYCIVRGSGNELALILNVRYLSGIVIRTMRNVAELVRDSVPEVISAFLYVDESSSDYYLEAERPAGRMGWKKLFGPEALSLRLSAPEQKKFLFPPTVFSQINESILPAFAETLRRELSPQPEDRLLDLYCGYGLWSLLLADRVQAVWGAELSPEAVKAARSNGAWHFPKKTMRFEIGSIDPVFLKKSLPEPGGERELILLDPPRRGTLPGVLELLISRRPRRIAHVFCGIDELPGAMRLYAANGCRIEKLIPFDFFPGTLNVEMLVLIAPPAAF